MLDLRTPWTENTAVPVPLRTEGVHTPIFGFLPAFRDLDTGETHLCLNPDGSVASVHILDSLPQDWVEEWGDDGRPMTLLESVAAGFVRAGRFYTAGELILDTPIDA
jgi:hypothetical protein